MTAKVDAFLAKAKAWRPEMEALRAMLLAAGLEEDFKWYKPCYTYLGGNVVILAGLKNHCWLAFFKGAVLPDPAGLLERAGENTQAGRVIKFTSLAQITAQSNAVNAIIAAAIEAEKGGVKVEFRPSSAQDRPDELIHALAVDADFAAAFNALTPGRQRGWCLQFAGAKQSATRSARVQKAKTAILAGRGPNDRP